MKKTVLSLIVFLILLLTPSKVKAQAFTAEKAYSDYQYQLSIYQEDYSNFQEAKTFYLANPTLQLKEDARQKTLKMLKDRDQLMVVYLTALRMQIVESTGFDDSQKGAIFGKLDQEIDWYKKHIPGYIDSFELVDLFNKADESRSRNETDTTPIIDEALFDIGLSQEIGIRLDHQKIYSDLRSYIDVEVAKGTLKIDPFNRWLNDTDSVLQLLQKNETTAAAKIQTIYTQNYGGTQTYTDAIQMLVAIISPLSQLNNYLTEMLATIQNQLK